MRLPGKPSIAGLASLLALLAAGCGGGGGGGSSGSHFQGGMVYGSGTSGSVSFTIAGADAFLATGPSGTVDASGSWSVAGVPASLAGTYTGTNKLMEVAGVRSSTTYTFATDPPSGAAARIQGGVFGTGSAGYFVALRTDGGVSTTVLCGTGSGASMGAVAVVLGSDGTAATVAHFQTIPAVMEVTRTGTALSADAFGYTFSGTLSGTGRSITGTVTDGGSNNGTWTATVDGC